MFKKFSYIPNALRFRVFTNRLYLIGRGLTILLDKFTLFIYLSDLAEFRCI